MDKKQAWLRLVREKSEHYLNLHDGGFDEKMRARLVDCDYEAQTVTYAFPTQDWQINEKGGIHGGAIAGMFDTAFGVVANFTAGDNEATTTDMTVSFLRGVDFGMELHLTVFIGLALLFAAGDQGERHDESQQQRNYFFHVYLLIPLP